MSDYDHLPKELLESKQQRLEIEMDCLQEVIESLQEKKEALERQSMKLGEEIYHRETAVK